MQFQRTQHELDGSNSTRRQHYIPAPLHNYAVQQQLAATAQAGRGRGNLPTLADIYYELIKEGLDLVNNGRIVPVFTEPGRLENSRSVQIKFGADVNTALEELKELADAGEYEVKPYKQISLIGLAVNLIEVAVEYRKSGIEIPA